jgi:Peptidase family M48
VRKLGPEELEAVLAHEVSHLANRDGAVMAFASFPALTSRQALASASWKLWVFGFPVMLVVYASCGAGVTISSPSWPATSVGLPHRWPVRRGGTRGRVSPRSGSCSASLRSSRW